MLRSSSVVPLAMVLLSACVFTTMNSFQTTFADSRHLDFDVFHVTYTIAVIGVRLGLARVLPGSASDRVVAVTTIGVTVAPVAFVFVGTSPVLYCLASLLLGCTYGLGLPAFQARAVDLAGPGERVRMLPMAGLLLEVAILAFPVVAGAVVHTSGYRGLFVLLIAITLAVRALGQVRGRITPVSPAVAASPPAPEAQARAQVQVQDSAPADLSGEPEAASAAPGAGVSPAPAPARGHGR